MAAPDAFDLSEVDGHSTARFDVVPPEMQAQVRKAADTCPERAIIVSD
jgi:ferredoxin